MNPDVLAAVEAAGALHQAGRLDEARAAYEALLSQPNAPRTTLLHLLAVLHTQAGRPDAALADYDALVAEGGGSPAVDQARAEALNDRGLLHAEAGRQAAALADYDAALALRPELAVAWSNRSAALRRLGRRQEALESAEQALTLRPGVPDALNMKALALLALNAFEDAVEACNTAVARRPAHAQALNTRGLALSALGRFEAAETSHQAAAAHDPTNAAIPYNLALLALRRGDFAAGWRGYEHRWRRPGQPGPTYPDDTLWVGGDDICGCTVLLHAEQGMGDTLQFVRYAPLAKAAGARVVLEVQPPLVRLLCTLEGVDDVRAAGEPPPRFDRHTPLMSLPLAFAAAPDDPRVAVPYLHADPDATQAWRARASPRRRVALAWRGNPAHENDHNRSIPLAALECVVHSARAAGAEVVSLQPSLSQNELETLVNWGAEDFGSALGDFADTAAALAATDLLVSVDTSVVHLAGALGRPAWLLAPAVGDWRWMDGRADSPWYPSLRLFRQDSPGDWAPAIQAVADALFQWGAA